MNLKDVLKSYMDTIKEKFSKVKNKKKQENPLETSEKDKSNETEIQPYDELIGWVEKIIESFDELKRKFYIFENEEEKHVLCNSLIELRKYIHLLPTWKKTGVMEFSGDNFDQSVEYVESQLFDKYFNNRIDSIYLVEELQKFLSKKTQIQDSLQHLTTSYLTDEIKQVIEYMNLIEGVIKKPHNLLHVNDDKFRNMNILSQEDSKLVGVYLSKIRKIKQELSQIEKYYTRSENLRDQQQLDNFMQRYGLHSKPYIKTEEGIKFLEKTPIKAFNEAIMLMDESNVKHFNVFSPESPDKFIAAMESLFNGISFKQPEGFDWEVHLEEIIEKYFVRNELFNKLLSAEEEFTEQNAKQIIESTFQAIKEVLSHTYLSLGINLELKYEAKAPIEFVLGSNSYTNEMKSQITIYEDELKRVVEKLPSNLGLQLVISTMLHETGHAVDNFWNKIVRSKSTENEFLWIAQSSQNKAKNLRELLEVKQLDQDDLFFLACLSPTLFEYMQKNGKDNKSREELLTKLNNAEYMESREERVARKTSATLTKLLYSQLFFFYKDNPEILNRLSEMYKSADKVSESYYSYNYLEELEEVDSITGAIFEDLSKVPADLTMLDNLCADFGETKFSNEVAEELNLKREKIFSKYYYALTQEDKALLLKKTLQGGHIFLLKMLLEEDRCFEEDDVIAFFKKISQVDFKKTPLNHKRIVDKFLHICSWKEEQFKRVFSELAKDKNIDMLEPFLSSHIYIREFITEEQLYDIISELPESEKEKESFSSALFSIDWVVNRKDEDTLVHKKLMELIQLEKDKEQQRNMNKSSTALIQIK